MSKVKITTQNLQVFLVLSFMFVVFGLAFLVHNPKLITRVFAVSESDCLNKSNLNTGEIDECINIILPKIINAYLPAQEKNKQDLANLKKQLSDLSNKITSLSKQLAKKEIEIEGREEDLAFAQEIFEEKAREQYINNRLSELDNLVLMLLSATSATDFADAFRRSDFLQRMIEDNFEAIGKYADSLAELKNDRKNLEKNKKSLASLQKQVDERAKFLQSEVDKVESYLSSLSAKQNELIALKAGGFSTSVGDTPPTLEPCSGAPGTSNYCDPGFRPAFAAFSFGAPHRTGMSQYGAYGRSKSGQNAETILAAYFQGAELNKNYPVPATISVSGYGNIPFEDNYLLGIYEVPESWGDSGGFEALKAQAVAARSYALQAKKPICTDEKCQVYKPQLKSGKWLEAVRATRGWVITKGGTPASTYYAASSGGFTISQWGWAGIRDTAGDWPNGAYEKISASPWFYKGWYRIRSGATCGGKNNPWLTSSDMADILNAWKVLFQGGGDVGRIYPPDGCGKGNPYSKSELAGVGGYTDVSGVAQVIYGNDGSTASVRFSTNKGDITINGSEFKKAFNLRAPGYIGLKSSLFNIEKL